MRAKLRHWAQNLGVCAVSILACLLILEFIVFRFILIPDDVIHNVSINGVMRYQPDTKAIFRHPDGRTTKLTINKDGWNSPKPAYRRERTPGTLRIAVIGDSYVHGAYVNVEEGFPEVLEAALNKDGVKAEVLRFGMDGAPLSQYLHMLRGEVREYRPDLVVMPIIHNDFDETYRFLRTRYASSFMKVGMDDKGRVIEIPPADFRAGLADRFRNFATFRYLYYKTNFHSRFRLFINRHFWGGDEDWAQEFLSSAVDIRKIRDHDKNEFYAHYVMGEMKRIAEADGFQLAFFMDGVREAVYSGKPVSVYEVGRLNDIAADVARDLDLPFLDLQQAFTDDFAANRERFEFLYDWHWNVRGNVLVGTTMARFLKANPKLLNTTGDASHKVRAALSLR